MWIIRNAAGEICGHFTNRPGPGNKMPDGSDEVPIYVEDDPAVKEFDQAVIDEISKFGSAQAAQIQAKPATVEAKLAAVGLTVADLKDALSK